MLRTLLICGMIAGVCAGLLGFGFARVAGEGSVEAAIHVEETKAKAAHEPQEPAVVERGTQKSVGLLTATTVYGVALGGLFALVFAAVYGRIATAPPSRTAIWLAGLAFLVLFLIPFLKYPANPPATGDPETIQQRTLLYLTMVAASLLSAVAAVRVRALVRREESWRPHGTLVAVASYVALVGIVMLILPGINEVPNDFPATSLYTFRAATVGLQLTVWTTIGLVFAILAQRKMVTGARAPRAPSGAAPEAERA
ncbi:MAG: CbtA family protein [Solirubrobacteraceae bacterium]